MLPVEQPAVLGIHLRMLILIDVIRRQIVEFHQARARVRQIAEFILPLHVTALMHVVRGNGGIEVRCDIPVIR